MKTVDLSGTTGMHKNVISLLKQNEANKII